MVKENFKMIMTRLLLQLSENDLVKSQIVRYVSFKCGGGFSEFLTLPNQHISCCVTGKRRNNGDFFGLKVHADYIFYETAKALKSIAKKLHNMQVKKCLK